jgi:peroxiredoxin
MRSHEIADVPSPRHCPILGTQFFQAWSPVAAEEMSCPEHTPVTVDIKPGSYPNTIRLASQGVVPVAVLTTMDFDASQFTPEMAHLNDATTTMSTSCGGAMAVRWARDDVNRDGHPDLALPQLDGTQLTLRELRGHMILINIWATWCPPCRAEMPAIQQAYAAYRDRGFIVVGVNQREDASVVAPFVEQHGLTFPILLDRDGQASAAYQANALPSSFFVDRNAVIRVVYRGPMPTRVIAGTIEQLLQERP